MNLEEPLTRWAVGVDSEDHFLDLTVQPDRSWLWRDEDEFAQAQRDGLMELGAGRAGAAGRAGCGGGGPRLGIAVLGRLAGLAPGPVLAGTVTPDGLSIARLRESPRETLDAPPGGKRRIVLRKGARRQRAGHALSLTDRHRGAAGRERGVRGQSRYGPRPARRWHRQSC
ncbi:hypothetical protein SFUMM280S_03889 [Streptomyces fumanus]